MAFQRHSDDLSAHPDVAEMRQRYAQAVESRRAVAVDGLILLAGVYAAISPWVIHFQATDPALAVNNLIVGITLAVIGLGLTMVPERMFRLVWTVAPLGVWLIISPWVVTPTHGARAAIVWNNCWIGGVSLALGLSAIALTAGLKLTRGPR